MKRQFYVFILPTLLILTLILSLSGPKTAHAETLNYKQPTNAHTLLVAQSTDAGCLILNYQNRQFYADNTLPTMPMSGQVTLGVDWSQCVREWSWSITVKLDDQNQSYTCALDIGWCENFQNFTFSVTQAPQMVEVVLTSTSSSDLGSGQDVHDGEFPVAPNVCYQAHVENIGWQNTACNSQVAGTTGQSLRMEAIQMFLPHVASGVGICYQAHVENIGWQNTVCNHQLAGTTGQSLRMEAIRVYLTGLPASVSVCYRAHVENIGWQNWVCNGDVAGTTGQSLRIEALQVQIQA